MASGEEQCPDTVFSHETFDLGLSTAGPERAELFFSSKHAPSGRLNACLAISWICFPASNCLAFAKVFLECQAGRADSLAKSPKKKEE